MNSIISTEKNLSSEVVVMTQK